MKKIFAMLLVGALGLSLLTACGTEEEEVALSVDDSKLIAVVEEEVEEEPDTPEGMARSYLTGEWIDEDIAAQRPVAVMTGNTKDALPQYGIGSADIIYEVPVESDITRLMAIYQDYESVEKIMSIRSCRLYYIDWALEFDAIYIHYGQAYLAENMLSQSYVNNLSGLDGSLNAMFFRDSSRSAPHNAYTTGEAITTGIGIKGYATNHAEDYEGHYIFNEDDAEEIYLTGTDASVVEPGYSFNNARFVYDPQTGLYSCFQFGSPHVDGLTGEQLTCKNILIQINEWSVADADKGYLSVETVGSGSGYYITNGKAIPVTWSKNSQTAPTRYFDEDKNEIVLNQGKTWVCIVKDTYADKIAISGDGDATEE